MHLHVFVLLVSVSWAQTATVANKNVIQTTVRAVAIISRHSDRTTEYTFPTDPHPMDDRNEWPDGEARLVPLGRKRAQMFADLLRSRYEYMFTNNPAEVLVRSSGAQRCIDTARIVSTTATRIPDLEVKVDDRLLRDPPPNCPATKEIGNQLFKTSEAQSYQNAFKDLLKTVTKETGKPVQTIEDAYEIDDTLTVEAQNGKTLPKWATPEVRAQLKQMANTYSCVASAPIKAQKLRLGLFLTDLENRFKAISAGNSSLRLLVHTTHDTEIAMLRRRLNAFDKNTPAGYVAAIVFELHQDVNTLKPYVRSYYIFLDQTTLKPVETPAIPSSCLKEPEPCPLDKYFYALEPFMLDDAGLDKECAAPVDLRKDGLEQFDQCFTDQPASGLTKFLSAINPFS